MNCITLLYKKLHRKFYCHLHLLGHTTEPIFYNYPSESIQQVGIMDYPPNDLGFLFLSKKML